VKVFCILIFVQHSSDLHSIPDTHGRRHVVIPTFCAVTASVLRSPISQSPYRGALNFMSSAIPHPSVCVLEAPKDFLRYRVILVENLGSRRPTGTLHMHSSRDIDQGQGSGVPASAPDITECLSFLRSTFEHQCILQIVYEAYGAGGTGFIMECLTDNVNRSATGESAHSYAWAVWILQWSGHSRVTVMKRGEGFEHLSSTAKFCHFQAFAPACCRCTDSCGEGWW